MRAGGKSRASQRSCQKIAVVDRNSHSAAVADIKVRMRCEECFRFGVSGSGKTIDVMMAVAFGMANADQGAERQILLHAETGLTGEILAGDEEFFSLRAPFFRTHRIESRLVNALAGFRRDTAIAERLRSRKCVVGV